MNLNMRTHEKTHRMPLSDQPIAVPLSAVEALVLDPANAESILNDQFVVGSRDWHRVRAVLAINQTILLNADEALKASIESEKTGLQHASNDGPSASLPSHRVLAFANALKHKADPSEFTAAVEAAVDLPKFNHAPPPDSTSSNVAGSQQKIIPSTLDRVALDAEVLSVKLRYPGDGLAEVAAPELPRIARRILESDEKLKSNLLVQLLNRVTSSSSLIDFDGVDHLPAMLLALNATKASIPTQILSFLTLEQLAFICNEDGSFLAQGAVVHSYVYKLKAKHLQFDSSVFSDLDGLTAAPDNLKGLDLLIKFASRFPNVETLNQLVLLKLEYLLRRRNEYDVALFRSYLQNNYIVTSSSTQENLIIETYLLHIFKSNPNETREFYSGLVRESVVRNIYARVKILYTAEGPNWHHLLSPSELKVLTTCVTLEFLRTENPTFLSPDTPNLPSSLRISTQNISQVEVNEYNVDTFALSVAGVEPMTLDLSGVVPHRTRNVVVPEFVSGRVFEIDVEMPWIADVERGVVVVEVVGGSKRCRAVVRKGAFRLVETVTRDGHLFAVLDETGKAIVSKYNIFLAGHVFEPNSSGEVLIPFTRDPSAVTAIITYKGYSFPVNFTHHSESWLLDAYWLFNREAVRVGNTVTVAVRSLLRHANSGTRIPIQEVIKVEKTVLTVKVVAADGLESVKIWEAFELSEDKEATFEVVIPPKLKNLEFKLEVCAWNATRKEDEVLSATKEIQVNAIDDSMTVETVFFQKVGNDYYTLRVLGKNGEPRKKYSLEVHFKPRAIASLVSQLLCTNELGNILLGTLEGIEMIGVVMGDTPMKCWNVGNPVVTLPNQLTLVRGSPFLLPLGVSKDSIERCSWDFVRVGTHSFAFNGHCIESFDKLITFKHVSENSCELVLDTELPIGSYKLSIFESKSHIDVVQGKSMKASFSGENADIETSTSQSFVLTGTSVKHLAAPTKRAPAHVAGIDYQKNGFNVIVKNATASTRLHCIVSLFTPVDVMVKNFIQVVERCMPPTSKDACVPTCSYSETQNLQPDLEYVLKRKADFAKDGRIVGNTLKKPSVLLDTWETQKTSLLDTSLDGAVQEQAFSAPQARERMRMVATPAPMSSMFGQPAACGGFGQFGSTGVQASRSRMMKKERKDEKPNPVTLEPLQNDFTNYDFLAENGQSMFNLKPSPDGTMFVSLHKLVSASNLEVAFVVVDSDATSMVTCHVQGSNEISLNDTSIMPSWRLSSSVTEVLSCSVVSPEKSLKLSQGSDFAVISDLSKLYSIAETFATRDKENLSMFRFITKWLTFSKERKLSLFSEFSCHELNVFLYFKDPDFFGNIVKPHLQNKSCMTAMDTFLLGDADACQRSLADLAGTWQDLTIAERILLVKVLMENGLKDCEEIQIVKAWITNQYKQDCVSGNYLTRKLQRKEKIFSFLRNSADATAETDDENEGDDDGDDDDDEGDMGFQLSPPSSPRPPPGKSSFYEPPPETSELSERYYYKRMRWDSADISMSEFWKDFLFAVLTGSHDFVSEAIESCLFSSFTEIMIALAVSNIGFATSSQVVQTRKVGDQYAQITVKVPSIVYHKEFKESDPKHLPGIICNTQYIDPENDKIQDADTGDWIPRHIDSGTQRFLTGKVYALQVTITNTMATPFAVSALVALPAGSLPVKCCTIKTHHFTLQPYMTTNQTFFFYFPKVGEYLQYPIHIANRKNEVIASSSALKLVAVDILDKSMLLGMKGGLTWEYVSASGTDEEVVDWLQSESRIVDEDMMEDILFRLGDRSLWEKVIAALKSRGIFCSSVWAFALKHQSREYLAEWVIDQTNANADGPIYLEYHKAVLDQFVNQNDDILSYWPLINARAHEIGQRTRANNVQFMDTYCKFVSYLFAKPPSKYSRRDHVALICYLLLQDRLKEALARFRIMLAQIEAGLLDKGLQLQIDYLKVWFDFIIENASHASLEEARHLALSYKDYPVKSWNELFASVVTRCQEFDLFYSAETSDGRVADGNEFMESTSVINEPSLTFSILSGDSGALDSLRFVHHNISSCQVRFHSLNLEMEFSSKPFVVATRFGTSSSNTPNSSIFTTPHHTLQVDFPSGSGELVVTVPGTIKRGNVAIEISANNGAISQMRVASETSLKVLVTDQKGMMQVIRSEAKDKSDVIGGDWSLPTGPTTADIRLLASRQFKPVPSVYIKVYAKLSNGKEVFYKDGYTDLLGRFDYVSLSNTGVLARVQSFALLASSDLYGDAVLTARPPKV
ncbi:hypothetical protein BC830DRAFT_1123208 [Chytriomyces sp. MP71]|nr:hypothetical protein BC830DRAFT_1123208 [Chytriomyces sp. MP71]